MIVIVCIILLRDRFNYKKCKKICTVATRSSPLKKFSPPRGRKNLSTCKIHYNPHDKTVNQTPVSYNPQNFVSILSELSRGSMEEKLRWAFSLYDIDGDGFISRGELLAIVSAVYSLVGRAGLPLADDGATAHHVDRIFEVGVHVTSFVSW